MLQIGELLLKFKGLINSREEIIRISSEEISRILKKNIQKDRIVYKNAKLSLKLTPIEKTEIIIHKQAIIELIEKRSGAKVLDIF